MQGSLPTIGRFRGEPSWSALKAGLQGSDPWLKAFEIPFSQRISAAKVDTGAFDPFQIRSHVERAGELAALLTELEKQAFELEIDAVRSAADYQLALEDGRLALELEQRRLRLPELQAQADGFAEAAALYEKGGETARARHERTLATASGEALTEQQKAGALLEQRFALRRSYEETFHARHVAPGNAHNYAERFQQIVLVASQIYAELMERVAALSTGVELVFGLEVPPPAAGATPAGLRSWLEKVRRDLSVLTQSEAEFTLVVPLTQPWGPAGRPLVSEKAFDAAMQTNGAKRLRFDLSGVLPDGENLRLLAVGVALDLDADRVKLDKLAYFRAQVTLTLPEQHKSAGAFRVRLPVPISNAGVFARSLSIATESHVAIENTSPSGEWELLMEDLLVGNIHLKWSVAELSENGNLKDVKLFLRCRGKIAQGRR